MLHGIGFLGTFFGCLIVGILLSAFFILRTILGIVCGVSAPVLLAQVTMIFLDSYLGNLDGNFSIRSLDSPAALVRSFLMGLFIESFLGTYTLNILEREKRSEHISVEVVPFL